MQKDDRITEAGTEVDSDMKPIELPSASIEANPLLPAVFASLEQYVIERKEKYFVLKIPLRIQIDFNRDLILSLFENVITHYTSGDNFQTIEVFEK